MSLFKFSDSWINAKPETFSIVTKSTINHIITYVINSKYRTAVQLNKWLKSQDLITVKAFSDTIETIDDYDLQIIAILKKVRSKIEYKGDESAWKMKEHWNTAEQTLDKMEGDCEDGAILMYLIAREKGIPINRLTIFTGDTNNGGHCWLGYKPQNYPLNYAFIDWCYYCTLKSIDERNFFTIIDKDIYEYKQDNTKITSEYNKIWFGFNEEAGYDGIKYEFKS